MDTKLLRDLAHMKRWWDQEGVRAAEEIDKLRKTFGHIHVNNGKDDACKECGLDLRDKIHHDEKQEQGKKATPGTHSICSELLSAEATLTIVTKQMSDEYKEHGDKWPRDWMQKHTDNRNIIIKAREILLDRAGR